MPKTIAISGGHYNSALVVARQLTKLGHRIIWFGAKYTNKDRSHLTVEYRQVSRAGVTFIELEAPRLFNLNPLIYGLKLAALLPNLAARWRRWRIDLFLGWGGYLMIPCALAAWLNRTPIFIHEQTRITGRANQVIGQLAKLIFVSWPVNYHFPAKKTIYTGLPLTKQFLTLIQQPDKIKPLINNNYPTIFITAGKQGSIFINQTIKPLIAPLLKSFNIIHQTGHSQLNPSYPQFKALRNQLDQSHGRYLVYDYLDNQLITQAYHQADLIIARGGAHTTYELALLGKPAIIIPAPFVPRQEQLHNANFLQRIGVGVKLDQDTLTPAKLRSTILSLKPRLGKRRPHSLPTNADQQIIHHLKPWL